MKKKIVGFFLLLILSTQVLPLQQMGNSFFSNLPVEEIPHGLELDKDEIKKADAKNDFITLSADKIQSTYLTAASLYRLASVVMPVNHSSAIEVPPPNFFL